MSDDPTPSALERIADILTRHGVQFIVIGGQAEWILGSPRVTYDVDLCYRRDADNLARLAAALREIRPALRGAPPDLPLIIDQRFLSLGSNFTFDTPIVPLDLLGWVEPLGEFDALAARAETYRIGRHDLRVIALDDLIRIKEHIGRPKDRESLLQLLAIRRLREQDDPPTTPP